MKRATVTLPDDLATAVDDYVQAQEAPPALTSVVQAALRQYLEDRGFLSTPSRRFTITPASHGSGKRDISQAHDQYFARTRK